MPSRALLAAAFSVSLLLGLAPGPTSAEVAAPVQPYRAGDRSLTALNILPPGQGRYLNSAEFLEAQASGPPPENVNQRDLYASLIQGVDGLTEQNLTDYFKDASFGVREGDVAREYSPRDGVTILRDQGFNVPHIYGETRADTMFGAGYASAEDRLFMMDVLRHTGRGRLTEFIGPSVANLQMDCTQWRVAAYTDAELEAMVTNRPPGIDQELVQRAFEDLEGYVAGVNAYIDEALADASKLPAEYPALQVSPEPWTISDTVAVASLIGGNLGVGGGGEIGNALFLNALEDEGFTPTQARQILADLRHVDDPEAPSSTGDVFPYDVNLGPVDPASVAVPDDPPVASDDTDGDSCGTDGGFPLRAGPPTTVDGPLGPIPLIEMDRGASNALLVGSKLSSNRIPIAVFGPQVAYWSPEILMELDMHGPGLQARGVGFPGISLYVLLGRGDGYGYSATSASGDQVDTRAVALCDPAGTPTDGYLRFDGQCTEFETIEDSWIAKPTAGSCPTPNPLDPGCQIQNIQMVTERAQLSGLPGSVGLRGGNWGIVQSRGEIDGTPVAFVRQRVTYGGEVDSSLAYVEMMDPDRINGPEDFQRAFGRFNFTFNWFYVDGRSIAFQLGGMHPVRAANTDPDLPVWDATEWAWQRPLTFEETPRDIDPERGYITSWNNKQAPGFRAADDNWGFASVDRVQPLDDGLDAALADDGKIDLVEVVQAMGDAATVDLRGEKLVPLLDEAIGSAGGPQVQQALDLLAAWHDAGAHRRDLDGDGQYEHQAAIDLIDEWWPLLVEAVFGDVLGAAFEEIPYTLDDRVDDADPDPNVDTSDHNGSSFNDGFYGHVSKDLRSILGQAVQAPYSRVYCGSGVLADCRTDLAASLQDAVDVVSGQDGQTTDQATWDADETEDEIRFTGVGVVGVDPIPWQNRPTFQQVLQFSAKGCPGKKGANLTQIVGTDEADRLLGTRGRDVICGFGGKDRLTGRGGNDILLGGGGKDRLRGHKGNDRLKGGNGNDRLQGGPGKDRLRGQGGKDRCVGGPGTDRGRCERGHT